MRLGADHRRVRGRLFLHKPSPQARLKLNRTQRAVRITMTVILVARGRHSRDNSGDINPLPLSEPREILTFQEVLAGPSPAMRGGEPGYAPSARQFDI